jgi:hypothetical protein
MEYKLWLYALIMQKSWIFTSSKKVHLQCDSFVKLHKISWLIWQERNSRVFDDVPVEATARFVDASGMRDVVSEFRRMLGHCWIFFQ